MKAIIVGLGSIGKRHLQNLKRIDSTLEIAVLREHSKKKDCDELSPLACQVFTETKAALQWGPRMAFIANPASRHIETGLQFARENVHLFIEKPISNSLKDVDRLLRECRERQLVLMLGYVLRFSEALRIMKDAIDQGNIGRVLSIQAYAGQYLEHWRPEKDYRENVSGKKELGGGVVFELSHEIDYCRWFCGEVKRTSAFMGHYSDLKIDVEDIAEIILEFEHGAIGHIHLDMVDHARHRGCRIVGSEGTLVWDLVNNDAVRLFSKTLGQWADLKTAAELDRNDMYVAQLKHFIHCVKKNAVPLSTGEDGKKVLEIILAAKQSAQEGVPLSV